MGKERLNGSLERFAAAFGEVLVDAVEAAVGPAVEAAVGPIKQDMAQLRQALEVTDGNVLELKTDVTLLKKDVTLLKKDMAEVKEGLTQLRADVRSDLKEILSDMVWPDHTSPAI